MGWIARLLASARVVITHLSADMLTHAEHPLRGLSGRSGDASYAWHVPVDEVVAHDLQVGDVVRLDDPQAHRVERVVLVDRRVVVDLRPLGLDVADLVRVTLPVDSLVDRLGMAAQ